MLIKITIFNTTIINSEIMEMLHFQNPCLHVCKFSAHRKRNNIVITYKAVQDVCRATCLFQDLGRRRSGRPTSLERKDGDLNWVSPISQNINCFGLEIWPLLDQQQIKISLGTDAS